MFFILEWDPGHDCFRSLPGHRFGDVMAALETARGIIAQTSEERTLYVVRASRVLTCTKVTTVERDEREL